VTTEIRDESGIEAGDGGGSLRRHGRDGEGMVPAVWHGMRMQGMGSVAAARSVVGGGCWGEKKRSKRGETRRRSTTTRAVASWLQVEEKALATLIGKPKMDMGITDQESKIHLLQTKNFFFYHVAGIPLCTCIMC
jgi:hypothetical protein